VDDYTAFMTMLALPLDTRVERICKVARFVLFFLCRPLRIARAFINTARLRISSPLDAEYHSMTAYQLGADMVVRYIARPLGSPYSRMNDKSGDNYLHDALVAALNPEAPSNGPITFDFSVQIRHAATPADVEDACRPWTGSLDKKISLGRIEIPPQRFDEAAQMCDCEDISFNPWNCLPEHRPLGSLNRMRLVVYMASTQVRHRLNGLAIS
jgi:hypothetical protein